MLQYVVNESLTKEISYQAGLIRKGHFLATPGDSQHSSARWITSQETGFSGFPLTPGSNWNPVLELNGGRNDGRWEVPLLSTCAVEAKWGSTTMRHAQ